MPAVHFIEFMQLLLYLATAPEEKIKFADGGERAVTKFEEGDSTYLNDVLDIDYVTSEFVWP